MSESGRSPSQPLHAFRPLSSLYDQSSTSSSPSFHSASHGAGFMHSGPTSRPSSGPDTSRLQQFPLPPAPDFRSPDYNFSYGSGPSPSSHVQPHYTDFSPASRSATPGSANPHIPSMGLQAQKRAYRQRRKDPSCDACRERKVKVLSNWIKEEFFLADQGRSAMQQMQRAAPNARAEMQVQDLEKQLSHTRKQLHELRSVANDEGTTVQAPRSHSDKQTLRIETSQKRRSQPSLKYDLSRVRASLKKVGVGIFKLPYPYNHQVLRRSSSSRGVPGLPARHTADDILGQYHSSFHVALPILHWPSFLQHYEAVYREGSVSAAPRAWAALFFVVLGCGTILRVREDAQHYLDTSKTLVDPWDEDVSLEHARCALLTSILLVELNMKSAGWVWLGNAVRIAQDLGLHGESYSWPSAEAEIRRRVWWSIYVCDRLLSLELGRPAMINDEDTEVILPIPIDDQCIPTTGPWTPPHASGPPSSIVAVFEVIQVISRLLRGLRSPVISSGTLQAYESLFSSCIAAFPSHHQIRTKEYLHPCALPPAIYLQSARLALYRHNLMPSCSADERAAAVDRCLTVAQDTIQLIARCMQDPPGLPRLSETSDTWEARFKIAASAFLCTHIWRCTLFLCFRGDYNAALLCTRASAAIDDARPVNVACARYLDFFLRRLIVKIQRGDGAYLDSDEEMMAYVSGDLQGSPETSWVWHEVANEAGISPTAHSPFIAESRRTSAEGKSPTPRDGIVKWSGWEGILATLSRLAQEQGSQTPQHRTQEGFTPRLRGQPMPLAPSHDSEDAQVIPFNASRMHIANII